MRTTLICTTQKSDFKMRPLSTSFCGSKKRDAGSRRQKKCFIFL